MDSLTQVVLGAAVGEATLGKKVGNHAALWGAVAGTIPDLDVIASPFQGELAFLVAHRGFTHSLLFCVIMAPALGWLIHRWVYKEKRGTWRAWSWLAFWAFFTHTMLDCFTTWGTQLFYPFSDYRVAFNSIFVVDPLYTLPFLICLIIALKLPKERKWRRFWNWLGIALSSFYLLLTLTNKLVVEDVFRIARINAGISSYSFSTYPTAFNNLLWYQVAEEVNGKKLFIGYYSLMDKRPLNKDISIPFIELARNEHLIWKQSDNYAVDRLRWVCKNQYVVEEKEGDIIWHDLRLGLVNTFTPLPEADYQFAFSYKLIREDSQFVEIEQITPFQEETQGLDFSEKMGFMYDRMLQPLWVKMTDSDSTGMN